MFTSHSSVLNGRMSTQMSVKQEDRLYTSFRTVVLEQSVGRDRVSVHVFLDFLRRVEVCCCFDAYVQIRRDCRASLNLSYY